jgi:predicted amidohydrolase
VILASAQTNPKHDNINANLNDHCLLIELAAKNGAALIVFPEMSITGYEREKAQNFVFDVLDPRLNTLLKLAVDNKIIVIAGAPVQIKDDIYIGSFVIKPDNSISIYTKQFLHDGEAQYFKSSFDYNPNIQLADEKITLAICADINHEVHAENASKKNTAIYVASIFYTSNGIPEAHSTLSNYANKYKMNVLMSNFCGSSWSLNAGGQSGFWDKNGKLIASLNDKESGLLIMEKVRDSWTEKTVIYD